jgi:translation elongation factor EF-Tu-like GTPase
MDLLSMVFQVMPGDNLEMVCELHHDVAAEVGSRYVTICSLNVHSRYVAGSRCVRVAKLVRTH